MDNQTPDRTTRTPTSHGKIILHPDGKVFRIRTSKRGFVGIPKSALKQAGMLPGTSVQVEVSEDGTLMLRPRPLDENQIDQAAFEQCVSEVLSQRKELLERLAK